MYDDVLLACVRGLVSNRPPVDRLFRLEFEGAEWLASSDGLGMALARVATSDAHIETEDRVLQHIDRGACWETFVQPVELLTALDRPLRENHGGEFDYCVIADRPFSSALIRQWLAPFLALGIEGAWLSDVDEEHRMLRIEGHGWVVIVMGCRDGDDITDARVVKQ